MLRPELRAGPDIMIAVNKRVASVAESCVQPGRPTACPREGADRRGPTGQRLVVQLPDVPEQDDFVVVRFQPCLLYTSDAADE